MPVNDEPSRLSPSIPRPSSPAPMISNNSATYESQSEQMCSESADHITRFVPASDPMLGSLTLNQPPYNSINRQNSTNSTFDLMPSCPATVHNSGRLHINKEFVDNDENTANVSSSYQQQSRCDIHNWQASKSTIKERIEFLFNNEVLADVYFIVGKRGTNSINRIPAHKFILSIGSAVFDAMFNGDLALRSDEIEIPDVEPAAFLALLRFLYSDNAQIEPETVMTTLYTAKKYAVPALETLCVEFLQRNLASDNAFMLLSQARLFDEPKLAAMCLRTIDQNTSDAIAADGFCDVDLETLCCVLTRDSLRIKETKLFQGLVRWSEAECRRKGLCVTPEEQRTVCIAALKLIRFPLMTVDEFAVGAAQSGLLTDKEIVSLFLYFTVNPKPAIEFSDDPRSIISGNELIVNRFQQVEMRWGYSGTCDRIRFSVDHPIFVIGFGLYGSIHIPSQYQVYIEIIQTSTCKKIAANDTTFSCDGTASVFRVMFEDPVIIQPNISYTASATIKGPDSHYGTKGGRKVIVETPIGKVTFLFSYSSGNNNGSSIEDGQIPQILFYV